MVTKKLFHNQDLEGFIALLGQIIKPHLTIVDGIYTMEKGPTTGIAHRADIILAGKNILECDIVGATLLGIDPGTVEHLSEFALLENRKIEIKNIDIKGDSIYDLRMPLNWQMDPEEFFTNKNISGVTFKHPGKSWCTSCISNVTVMAAFFSSDNTGKSLDDIEICCAKEVKAKPSSNKVFLFGKCAIENNREIDHAIEIAGCPPAIPDLLKTFTYNVMPEKEAGKAIRKRIMKVPGSRPGIYIEKMLQYDYSGIQYDESYYEIRK